MVMKSMTSELRSKSNIEELDENVERNQRRLIYFNSSQSVRKKGKRARNQALKLSEDSLLMLLLGDGAMLLQLIP